MELHCAHEIGQYHLGVDVQYAYQKTGVAISRQIYNPENPCYHYT